MEKKYKRKIGTRLLSWLMIVTMVLTLAPNEALVANAAEVSADYETEDTGENGDFSVDEAIKTEEQTEYVSEEEKKEDDVEGRDDASALEQEITTEIAIDTEEVATEEVDTAKEQEAVAFSQKKIIDQIEIKVEAPKGVFPADSKLSVVKIDNQKEYKKVEDQVEDKVEAEREDMSIEEMLLFDVSVLDPEGNELQPDISKSKVQITFNHVDADEKTVDELQVFHIAEEKNEVELLNTKDDVKEGRAQAKLTHFCPMGVLLLAEDPEEENSILINGKSFTDGVYTIAYGDEVELSLKEEATGIEYYYLPGDLDANDEFVTWDPLEGEQVFCEKNEKQYCILEPGTYYLTYRTDTIAMEKNGNYKLIVTKAKIAKPSVSWGDGLVLLWDEPTTTASGGYLSDTAVNALYDINVYNKQDTLIDHYDFSRTAGGYSEAGKIATAGFDTYYFTITAKAADKDHYQDSDPSRSEDVIYKDTMPPVINSYEVDGTTLKGTATDAETGIYAYAFSIKDSASDIVWNDVAKEDIKKAQAVCFTEAPTNAGVYYFYVKDAGDTVTKSDEGIANTVIHYHAFSYSSKSAVTKTSNVLGNTAIALETPERSGYTFGGWYTSDSLSDDTVITEIAVENVGTEIDLYAKWEKKDFALSLTSDKESPMTYDGTDVTLTTDVTNIEQASAVTYKWYRNDEMIPGATSSTYTIKNVAQSGTYKVEVTLIIDDGEEISLNATKAFEIQRKTLVIGVDNPKVTYGQGQPEYAFTYDSFATGDDVSVVTKGSVSCAYQKWDAVGSYPIMLSGFSADNYDISYKENMSLVVSEKDVTKDDSGVSAALEETALSGYEYVSGTAYEPAVTVTDTKLEGENKTLKKDVDYTVTYVNNSVAGTAEVQINMQGNYTGTITKNFEIRKADYEVSVHINGWKYGDYKDSSNKATISVKGIDPGIDESRDITYYYREKTGEGKYDAWSKVRPEDAGSYQVYAEINELANYNAQHTEPLDFDITKRNIILKTESGTWPYDGLAHSELKVTTPRSTVIDDVTYEADGFAGTDEFLSVSASETITNVSESPKVNQISATLISSAKARNYNIIKDEGVLTITPIKLATPSGIMWSNEEPGVASWLAVSRPNVEVEYHVDLYRIESRSATLIKPEGDEDYFTTTNVEYDFSEIIRADAGKNGIASYQFKVQAIPVGGTYKDNYETNSYSGLSSKLNTGSVQLESGVGVEAATFESFDAETMGANGMATDKMILLAGEKQSVRVICEEGYSRLYSNAWAVSKNSVATSEVSFVFDTYDYSDYLRPALLYTISLDSQVSESAEYHALITAKDDTPYTSMSFHSYIDNYQTVKLDLYMHDSKKLDSYCLVKVAKAAEYTSELKKALEKDASKWTKIEGDLKFYDAYIDVTEPGVYYFGAKDDNGQVTWVNDGITIYQISFDKNAGADFTVTGTMSPILKVHDIDIEELPATGFASDGAAFTGWQGVKTYTDKAKYTDNRTETLKAKWNTTQYAYTVNYYYMDTTGAYSGSPSETVEFKSFSNLTVSANDAKIKKNLPGLSLDADNSTKNPKDGTNSIVIVEENQQFNLYYKRAQYTMDYSYTVPGDMSAHSFLTETYYYGAPVAAEASVPTKEGYEFGGWTYDGLGDRPATMPNHNVVVEGAFKAKSTTYQVNYYGQNLAGDSFDVDLGSQTKNGLHAHAILFSTTSEHAKEIDGYRVSGVTITKGKIGNNNASEKAISATGTVSAIDGEMLQVNYFYTRETYALTLNVTKHNETDGSEAVYTATWNYKYEEPFDAGKHATYYEDLKAEKDGRASDPASFTDFTADVDLVGYTLADYRDWSTGEAPVNMPAGNVTVAREFIKDVDAEYRVNIFFAKEDGTYADTPTRVLKYHGTVGRTVTVGTAEENTIKIASFKNLVDGFTYYSFDEGEKNNHLSGMVVKSEAADGSDMLNLSVYFQRRTYTATINYYYGDIQTENGVDAFVVNTKTPFKTQTKTGKWGATFDCEPLKYFESGNGANAGSDINFKEQGYIVSYMSTYLYNDSYYYPRYTFETNASLTSDAYKTSQPTKFSQGASDNSTTVNVYYIKPQPDNHILVKLMKNTHSNLEGLKDDKGNVTRQPCVQYIEEKSPTVSIPLEVEINGTTYNKGIYVADKAMLFKGTFKPATTEGDYVGAANYRGTYEYGETEKLNTEKFPGLTEITDSVREFETNNYGNCSTYRYFKDTAGHLFVMINSDNQLYFGNRVHFSVWNSNSVFYRTITEYANTYRVSDVITGILVNNASIDSVVSGVVSKDGTELADGSLYASAMLTYSFRRKNIYKYYHNVLGNDCVGHEVAEGDSVEYESLNTCDTTQERPGYDLAIYKDTECTKPLTSSDRIASMNTNYVYYGNYVRSKIPYHKYAHYELANQEGEMPIRYVTKSMITDNETECYYMIGETKYSLTKNTAKVGEKQTVTDGTGQSYTFDVMRTTYSDAASGDPVLIDETWYSYSFTPVAMQYVNYGQTNFAYDATNTSNVLNGYCETKAFDMKAYFARETYDVIVHPKNSETANTTTTTYRVGQTVEVNTPSKDGYKFDSWEWSIDPVPTTTVTAEGITFKMPASNLTMDAKWTPASSGYQIEHYFQTPAKKYQSQWLEASKTATTASVTLMVDGAKKSGTLYEAVTGDTSVCVSYTDDKLTYYYTSKQVDTKDDVTIVTVTESDLFAIVEAASFTTDDEESFAAHKKTTGIFSFSNAVCNSKTGVVTDKKNPTFTVVYGMSIAYYYTRTGSYGITMVAKATDNGEVSATLTSAGETSGLTFGEAATITADVAAGYTFVGWYNAEDVLKEGESLSVRELKDDWKGETKLSAEAEYTFTLSKNVTLVAVVEPLDIEGVASRTKVTLDSERKNYIYGYDAESVKNIEATVQLPDDVDSAVYIDSYKWELVGFETPITEKMASYKFPTGKNAASYVYDCVVTLGRKDNGRKATVRANNTITITVGKASFSGDSSSYIGTYDGAKHGISASLITGGGLKEGTDYEIYYSDEEITGENLNTLISEKKAFKETVSGDAVKLPTEVQKKDVKWEDDAVGNYKVYYYIHPIGATANNYDGYGSYGTIRINPKTVSLQAKNTFIKVFDNQTELSGDLSTADSDKYRLSFGDGETKYYEFFGLVSDSEKNDYVLDFSAAYNDAHVQEASLISLSDIVIKNKSDLTVNHNYQLNKTELGVSGRIDPKKIEMTWQKEVGDTAGIVSTDENGVVSIQYTYDGKKHTPQAVLTSEIDGLSLDFSDGQVNVSANYKSVATLKGTDIVTSDYQLSQEECKYAIIGNAIEVKANAKEVTYDQNKYTLDEFTVKLSEDTSYSIKSGDTFTIGDLTYQLICDTVLASDGKTKQLDQAGAYEMVPNNPQFILVSTRKNVTDNFTITKTPATLTIKKKGIRVEGIVAQDKDYDGNANATLNYDGVSYTGLLTNDTLSLDTTKISGVFDNKNIGTDKTVTITIKEDALTGPSVANYALELDDKTENTQIATDTADILQVPIELKPTGFTMTYGDSVPCKSEVVAGLHDKGSDVLLNGSIKYTFTASNSTTYTHTYTLDGTQSVADLAENDKLAAVAASSLKLPVGTYTLTIDVSSMTSVNYRFVSTKSASVTVNQREITLTPKTGFTPALTKTYDGTTNVLAEQMSQIVANQSDYLTFSNVVDGDSVALQSGGFDAVYDDNNVYVKDVYPGATLIHISNMSLDNANYKVASTATLDLEAAITPKTLNLDPTAVTITYGEAVDATKYGYTATGMVTVDGVEESIDAIVDSVSYETTYKNSAASENRHVGTYPINITNIQLLTGNYAAACVNYDNKLTVKKKKVIVKTTYSGVDDVHTVEEINGIETDAYKMNYGGDMKGAWFKPSFNGFEYGEIDDAVLTNTNKKYDVRYLIHFGGELSDIYVVNSEDSSKATTATPHIAGNHQIITTVKDGDTELLTARDYEFEGDSDSILVIARMQLTLAADAISVMDKTYDGTKSVSASQLRFGGQSQEDLNTNPSTFNFGYLDNNGESGTLQSWDCDALKAAKSTGLVFKKNEKNEETCYSDKDVAYDGGVPADKTVSLVYEFSAYMKQRYDMGIASQHTTTSKILPKDLKIQAKVNPNSILYAGTMPTFSNVYTEFVSGEDARELQTTAEPSAGTGQILKTGSNGEYWLLDHAVNGDESRANVASYTVTPLGFVEGYNKNYKVSYQTATLEITQATLQKPVVKWKENAAGIVSFAPVSGIGDVAVDHYSMNLYKVAKSGEAISKTDITIPSDVIADVNNVTPDTEYDLLETIRAQGKGKYMVEVVAHASTINNAEYLNVKDSDPGASKVIYATNVTFDLDTDETAAAHDAAVTYPTLMSLSMSGSAVQSSVAAVQKVFVEGEKNIPLSFVMTDDAATGYSISSVALPKNSICSMPTVQEVYDITGTPTRSYTNQFACNTVTSENVWSVAEDTLIKVSLSTKVPTITITLLPIENQDDFKKTDDYVFANAYEAYLKYGYIVRPEYRIKVQAFEEGVEVTSKYDYSCRWYLYSNGSETITTQKLTGAPGDMITTCDFPSGKKVGKYSIACEVTAERKDKHTKVAKYGDNIKILSQNNQLFKTDVSRAPFSASVKFKKGELVVNNWTYGDERASEYIDTSIAESIYPVYYYSNTSDRGELEAWNAASAPSPWTKTKPTDAGTWYVAAFIPQTANYDSCVTEPTTFTIHKATLSTPANVTLHTPSDSNPYGTLTWDKVPNIYENADTAGGENHESYVEPVYEVTVSKKGEGDTYALVKTYKNSAESVVITEDKGTVTVNVADSLLGKGDYKIEVVAKAKCSNSKDNCNDSSFTIYPKIEGSITVSNDVYEKRYDASPIVLNADYTGLTSPTYQWFKDGKAIAGATNSTYEVKNVVQSGNYFCVATDVGGDHYTSRHDVTIHKRPLVVTAKNNTINYLDAASNDGVTYGKKPADENSGFATGETAISESDLTGSITYQYRYSDDSKDYSNIAPNVSPAGTYLIKVSGLSSNNYDISYETGTLTVSKISDASLAVVPKTIVYDGQKVTLEDDFTVTKAGTGAVRAIYYNKKADADEADTSNPLSEAPKNAGKYYIVITEETDTNYSETTISTPVAFEIAKRPLVVTANNAEINYKEAVPSYANANDGVTYGPKSGNTNSGFVGDDTAANSVDISAISYQYVHTDDASVPYNKDSDTCGTYDIKVIGITSDNYAIEYVKGTLTVKAIKDSSLTITANTMVYDGSKVGDIAPEGDCDFTVTRAGTGTVSLTYYKKKTDEDAPETTALSEAPKDAGKYYVVATQAADTNYSETSTAPVAFEIHKRPLVVTAKNNTINYLDAASNNGVTYGKKPADENSGFATGETAISGSDLTGSITYQYRYSDDSKDYSNIAPNVSPAGTYLIKVSGLSSNNYDISYETGTLIVSKISDASLAVVPKTIVYDGQKVTLEDDFTVTKAGTGAVRAIYYNKKADADEADTSNPLSEAPKNAGKYYIVITEEADTNYNETTISTPVAFEIAKRPLVVTANNAEINYKEAAPSYANANDGVTYGPKSGNTSSGFVGDDTAVNSVDISAISYQYRYTDNSKAYSNIAPDISPAGTYDIKVSGITSDNYAIEYVKGTLTVKAIKDSSLTITANTMVYDGSKVGDIAPAGDCDFTVARTGTGTVSLTFYKKKTDADAPESTALGEAPKDAGKYYVVATQAADTNYSKTSTAPVAFEIAKRPITIKPDAAASYYGEAIATLVTNVTSGSICSGDDLQLGATLGVPVPSEIGVYTITPTYDTSNTNYEVTPETNLYTITDNVNPVVTGVENGKVYCEDKAIVIKDANLAEVKITKEVLGSDGTVTQTDYPLNKTDYYATPTPVADVDFTLTGTPYGARYTIEAKDKSDNTNATMVVTVYEDHDFSNYVLAGDKHSKTASCEHNCGETDTITLVSPIGKVTVNTDAYIGLATNVSTAHYKKEALSVKIEAISPTAGSKTEVNSVADISYIICQSAIDIATEDAAGSIAWTSYADLFSISDEGTYIVYAKITDSLGFVEYLCTETYIIDKTNPVITGINTDTTYCLEKTLHVDDTYLDTLTVDGTAVTLINGDYTLTPKTGTYTIVATDKAGNETTISGVRVNAKHTWSYLGDGTNQILASCNVDTCGYYGKTDMTVTLSASDGDYKNMDYPAHCDVSTPYDAAVTAAGLGQVGAIVYYPEESESIGTVPIVGAPKNAGTYYAKVVITEGAATYSLIQKIVVNKVPITEITIADASLTAGTPNPYFVYDAQAHTPATITVKAVVNGETVTLDSTGYDIIYLDGQGQELSPANIRKVDTYTVKAVGKGNFNGSVTAQYEIKDLTSPVITMNDADKTALYAPEDRSYCGDISILVEDQTITKVKIAVKDGATIHEESLDCATSYTYTFSGTAEGTIYEITATDASDNETTTYVKVFDKHLFKAEDYVEASDGLSHTAACAHNCGATDTRAIVRGYVDWEYQYAYEEMGVPYTGVQGVDARATYARVELTRSVTISGHTQSDVIATQTVNCASTCGADENMHYGRDTFEFLSYHDNGKEILLPMEDENGNAYTYSLKLVTQKDVDGVLTDVSEYNVVGPRQVVQDAKKHYEFHVSYSPINFVLPWYVTLENLPKDKEGNTIAPESVNVKILFAYCEDETNESKYYTISQQEDNDGFTCPMQIKDGKYTYFGDYPVWKYEGGHADQPYYYRIQVVGYHLNGTYYDVSDHDPAYRSICDDDNTCHTIFFDQNIENEDGTMGAGSGTVLYTISNIAMPVVYFDYNEGADTTNAVVSNHAGTIVKPVLGAPVTDAEINAVDVSREHYEFLGWFTEADGGERVTSIEHLDQATTLYAHWRELVAPNGKIHVNESVFDILHTEQTFAQYEKDKLRVTIDAQDDGIEDGVDTKVTNSGIRSIEYYIASKEVEDFDQSKDHIDWTTYEAPFDIKTDGNYIIYSKLTDQAGNEKYLSTKGIILDTKKPVITGVRANTVYCEEKTIQVTDDYLNTVKVNGVIARLDQNGKYTLKASATPYTIVAVDKSGNETEIAKVTINNGHTYKQPVIAWSNDYSQATATFECEVDPTHEKLVLDCVVTHEIEEEATEDGPGSETYTATVTYNGETFDDDVELEIPMIIDPTSERSQFRNELALNAGLKVSQIGSKIKVRWGKVSDADGYKVFVQYCGKTFKKTPDKVVNTPDVTSVVIKKINGKALNLQKNYKLFVVAYKNIDGVETEIGRTITAHIVGRKNYGSTNVKAVKVKKTKFNIKVGKTAQIVASTVLVDKTKKQLSNLHATQFRYRSSDDSVATVSKKGKITARGAGTCYVYVYARNGYAKKVKVTVPEETKK